MSCVWKHIWIWFCERLTLSECHFVVGEKQLKRIFFKCRFRTRWNIHIEFQVLLEKIKPSFPPWIATEQPFQEVVLSSEFLDERSPIFYYCPWALSDCSSNVICNSEIYKKIFRCECTTISENNLVLTSCKFCLIVFECGYELAQTCSSRAQSRWEEIKHFFDATLRKNGIFRRSWFSEAWN